MPCSDGCDSRTRGEMDFEAVLCAVFSLLGEPGHAFYDEVCVDTLLDDVNWKEVGTTKATVAAWWKRHQEQDKLRKKQEAAELSKEEKAYLGIVE